MWKEHEFEITHLRGGGPGGQNRNKRYSGVRLVHRPSGISVVATERRSQAQNLKVAFQRMEQKLGDFFHREAPRIPTKRSQHSKEKRHQDKKRRAEVKTNRIKVRDTEQY